MYGERSRQRNALLCLNLQADYISDFSALRVDNAAEVVGSIKRVIAHARAQSWHVLHMHSRAPNLYVARGTPIAGLEPRPDEPVLFKRRYSALRSEELMRTLRETYFDAVYAVGFALAIDCIATAYDAVELGVPLTFIDGATGTPPMAEYSSNTLARVTHVMLRPLVDFTDIDSLIGASRAPLQPARIT